MTVFSNTSEGIINFRENVRIWAGECARHAEGSLTDEVIAKYREDYLSNMEIAEDDYEDAEWHFNEAFKEGWEEAQETLYVVLAKTSHGKPVWYTTDDPSWKEPDFITIMVLGPYLIGPGGYKTVEEAVSHDPNFNGSLDEPESWMQSASYDGEYHHQFLNQHFCE